MLALLVAVLVQSPAPVQVAGYERTEVMIPMRDGVKLHTVIERPVSASGPLPILLHRTPYG
ncbi:MAG TPA: CocE/NonD family hydrolase, partial [Gemmatimonadales bacterium]|nr:CocE/NonD family hydrolase [Gemmatimonadales bacterium]